MTTVSNLTPGKKTQGGIKYDQNIIADALGNGKYRAIKKSDKFTYGNSLFEKDSKYDITQYDTDRGHFVSMSKTHNGETTTHLLMDEGNDGSYDYYKLSLTTDDCTTYWIDDEFDGKFNTFIQEFYDSQGNTTAYSHDYDTDGKMDDYTT